MVPWQNAAKAGARILANEEGAHMASDPNAPRSRRALLTAAAGGAAAVAATAAMPLTTLASDPNDVVKGTDNPTTATTSITDSGDRTTAFQATNIGVAPALVAENAVGAELANPDPDPDALPITSAAGVYATSADSADAAPFLLTAYTGVYGWSPAQPDTTTFGAGVWGESDDVGVFGDGVIGSWGDGFIGVRGTGGSSGGVGVQAIGASATDIGLAVFGKVTFSRSGRTTIGAGRSSVKITLAGTTTSSRVFAVLHSNRAGRYVRAVVPTTGSFTIYLNTTVTSATYVAWFVLN